jgi:hypothetical protein
MQATNGSGGLCLTCNNAPSCFHRARRGPALFCELFDGYAQPLGRISSERASLPADSSTACLATEEKTSKRVGLCVNCDHRQACAYPTPEGGIWHCEDYE